MNELPVRLKLSRNSKSPKTLSLLSSRWFNSIANLNPLRFHTDSSPNNFIIITLFIILHFECIISRCRKQLLQSEVHRQIWALKAATFIVNLLSGIRLCFFFFVSSYVYEIYLEVVDDHVSLMLVNQLFV